MAGLRLPLPQSSCERGRQQKKSLGVHVRGGDVCSNQSIQLIHRGTLLLLCGHWRHHPGVQACMNAFFSIEMRRQLHRHVTLCMRALHCQFYYLSVALGPVSCCPQERQLKTQKCGAVFQRCNVSINMSIKSTNTNSYKLIIIESS